MPTECLAIGRELTLLTGYVVDSNTCPRPLSQAAEADYCGKAPGGR